MTSIITSWCVTHTSPHFIALQALRNIFYKIINYGKKSYCI